MDQRRIRVFLYLILVVALVCGAGHPAYSQEKTKGRNLTSADPWRPSILQAPSESGPVASQDTKAYPPYLPDFSFVGYRWGEEALPSSPGTVLSARNFGAVPDDGIDDTAALRRALREAKSLSGPVTVRLPAGRLIVREILFIERSRLVLQGQGSGEGGTTLYFPRPLREMNVPDGYQESPKNSFSPFSWEGGVIWTRNPQEAESQPVAQLVAGRRGGHVIEAARPLGVQAGEVLQIRWVNQETESLFAHVYCTTELEIGRKVNEIRQGVTVTEVDGRKITVKEPLLHDVRRYWNPKLYTTDYLTGVGIEHLRIEFPDVTYQGHHSEAGYNAVYATDLLHSWVRDVAIRHADSGVLVDRSKNLTMQGLRIGGRRGHYSVKLGATYGTLVRDLHARAHDLHNPSVNTYSRYNVYTDVQVDVPRLDQHRGANQQNLFDDVRATYLSRPQDGRLFQGSGSSLYKPRAAAFNTFWNLRVEVQNLKESSPFVAAREDAAPHARIVGLDGNIPLELEYGPNAYVEGLNRGGLAVPSLYDYQCRQRNRGQRPISVAIYDPLDGYQFGGEEPIPIKAEVIGDERVQRMEFVVDGEVIGEDTDGSDGWAVTWDDASLGRHRLRAVAYTQEGTAVPSRPMSCTSQDPQIWVGDSDGVLKGNAPNPFRNRTTIRYTLRRTERVQVTVYDMLGRRVRVLADRLQRAGPRKVAFEGKGLASGTYLYRVQTNSFQQWGKATLIR